MYDERKTRLLGVQQDICSLLEIPKGDRDGGTVPAHDHNFLVHGSKEIEGKAVNGQNLRAIIK